MQIIKIYSFQKPFVFMYFWLNYCNKNIEWLNYCNENIGRIPIAVKKT